MRNIKFAYVLLGIAWLSNGCGVKPGMQGAKSDSQEYGSVNDASSASGGNSTSFNADGVQRVDAYVVAPGDNLWNIAAKASVYHSGWLYPLIFKANRNKINDTQNLKVGIVLKIPRDLGKEEYEVAKEEAMSDMYSGKVAGVTETAYSSGVSSAAAAVVPTGMAKNLSQTPNAPKRHGWLWLLWLIVIALAGVGIWQISLMRSQSAAAGKGTPPR